MVRNTSVFQVPHPTGLRGWLVQHGLASFKDVDTVLVDEIGIRPGMPVLQTVAVGSLQLEYPTQDFALQTTVLPSPTLSWAAPEAERLWSTEILWVPPEAEAIWDELSCLNLEGSTENHLQSWGRLSVDGTIYLKETPPAKQGALWQPPQDGQEGKPRIVTPSQRRARATPNEPPALNLFELLLPILLPPEQAEILKDFEFPFSCELYPFQYGGVAFLAERDSALLADEMGLGKTVQSLVAMRLLIRTGQIRGGLIVCPKAVIPQWEKHLQDWAPDLVWYCVEGTRERRKAFWDALARRDGLHCHALLATYETIRQDQDFLVGKPFDLAILDEISRIRNEGIGITKAVRSLNARRRWGLSGAPLEGRVEDIVSIFDFLRPGLFGEEEVTPSAMMRRIEPYFLRRRKKEVREDLPEKHVQDQWGELLPAQREAYDRAEQEGIVQLKSGAQVTVQHVFALITRLKQICDFDPASRESAKADYLAEHLDDIVEEGHKVLVFSQYVEALKALENRLHHYSPLLYSGELSDRSREAVIDQFNKDQSSNLMLLSLRAGGMGLNLQVANFVFHFDHWWNPAVQHQAEDRVHRIGQTKEVFVKRLLTKDTIEERIEEILRRKQRLFDETIEGLADVDLRQSLTEEELFSLFDLKPPRVMTEEKVISEWQKVDSAAFEKLIAKLYEKMGYNTRVTGRSKDGGVDIEAWRMVATGIERVIIQCKHWPQGVVGASTVRDLLGVVSKRLDVNRAVLITSGHISREARSEAQGTRLDPVDGIKLRGLLHNYGL